MIESLKVFPQDANYTVSIGDTIESDECFLT